MKASFVVDPASAVAAQQQVGEGEVPKGIGGTAIKLHAALEMLQRLLRLKATDQGIAEVDVAGGMAGIKADGEAETALRSLEIL